jgi:hypothetical protein
MANNSFSGIGGHHSARSGTHEWLTPPGIIQALGGHESFDLDPCTPIEQPYPTARRRFTILDNGLTREWGDGRAFLNPPYSQTEIPKWLARMAQHNHGTALIFARTETRPFFRFVWDAATALLFIAGRINFHVGAPLACALGTAVLGEPKNVVAIFMDKVADSDRLDEHIYGWPLTDILAFPEPIPSAGAQGFWNWS